MIGLAQSQLIARRRLGHVLTYGKTNGANSSAPPCFWLRLRRKAYLVSERSLHTGEVVGAIPTAPTSLSD